MNLVPMIRQALTTSLLILALPGATLALCQIMPLTTVFLPGGTHGRYVPMYFFFTSFLVIRHTNAVLMTSIH